MSDLFYRLAPYIQEFIYRKGWTELRDAQSRAIEAILDLDDHVIIAAGTASGKTEAAFFPILTLLAENPATSFGALYIGPLKALINDQFERLNELLREVDIPVFAWHGDRSQSEKARAIRTHNGILQITPESLEALLMNRSGELKRMLSDLRFVVIDEVHAFMGQDRGLQLLCQLARIERLTGVIPRRIGLSATIHDYGAAKRWLAAGTKRNTQVIEGHEGGKKLNLAMECFVYPPRTDQSGWYDVNDAFTSYLYNQVRGRKCIVFTNSRSESEETIDALKETGKVKGESDSFYVHHGSLSAAVRAETELALKNAEGPTIAAATRTLELGIDLGGLDRVAQIGATSSCSSFVQRLGRSGRRGAPAEMRFLVRGETDGDGPFDGILWDLIQNIAIIQLFLEENWVETPREKPCPYSVLFHQTLSILTQSALKPPELARRVLTLPGLDRVPLGYFRTLLAFAIENDLIQKTDEGELIVGLAGEKLTNSYRFYSVFQDNSGYKVYSKERELGEIDTLPEIDAIIVLAGRRWRVVDIDKARGRIYVEPSKARSIPIWISGVPDVDDRIVARMRQVLAEDVQYGYLCEQANAHLGNARKIARQSEILTSFASDEGGLVLLHPWLGTRKMATLQLLLATILKEPLDIFQVRRGKEGLHIEVQINPSAGHFIDELRKRLKNMDESTVDLTAIKDAGLICDRYDPYVPRSLLEMAYIQNHMDVSGVKALFAIMGDRT